MSDDQQIRLPTTVVPNKYRLVYESIDLDAFAFNGTEEVDVHVNTSTSEIRLHALDLWLSDIVVSQGGTTIAATSVTMDYPTQTATLRFSEPLSVGPAVLSLRFRGILNDKMVGFYRSAYTRDGRRRFMAVTQFEACDARRAFACWDEPAMKASFEVTLVTPCDRMAISNMPVTSRATRLCSGARGDRGEKEIEWVFAETPVMSTYLLAYVVGDFDEVTSFSPEGVLVRVFAPPGKSGQGQFALSVAKDALSFFHQAFSLPYPLPKMDLLSIPDFDAGAMENWGCVTYRETRLLVDGQRSSQNARDAVARTVTHELAHQWFGNLVTMEWWTHLWLNEGFARYMEFFCLSAIRPSMDAWTTFHASVVTTALQLDALRSSHPVQVDVGHPDEIDAIFDRVSYAKGASIIGMLCAFLGRQPFLDGMSLYLSRHSYQNAATTDLWDALEESSGRAVREMMTGWTSQTGFPVITVAEDGSLSQTRFLLAPGACKAAAAEGEEEEEAPLWVVPLTALTADGQTLRPQPLPAQAGPLQFGEGSAEYRAALARGWVKLNAGQTAFCRVNYTQAQWLAFAEPLSQRLLPTVDRFGLLSDAFALAAAGQLPTTTALQLALACKSESRYMVWSAIASPLFDLVSLFSDQPFSQQFNAFVRDLVAPAANALGWGSDSDSEGTAATDAAADETKADAAAAAAATTEEGEEAAETATNLTKLRCALLRLQCHAGEESRLREARAMFAASVAAGDGGDSISPDLRALAYSAAVRDPSPAAAAAAQQELMRRYQASPLPEEQRRCLCAMAEVREEGALRRALDFALSGAVRLQDVMFPFSALGSSGAGHDMLWRHFTSDWAAARRSFVGFAWSSVLRSVVKGAQSEARVAEITALFSDKQRYPLGSAERALEQEMEGVRGRLQRLERDCAPVQQWLESL